MTVAEKSSPDGVALALGMEEPPGTAPPAAPPTSQPPAEPAETSQQPPSPEEGQAEACAIAPDLEVSLVA